MTDSSLAIPEPESLSAVLDSLKISKAARRRIEAAHYRALQAERDRTEASLLPANVRETMRLGAEHAVKAGYYQALRDVAEETSKYNTDAEIAAKEASDKAWDDLHGAPAHGLAFVAQRAASKAKQDLNAECTSMNDDGWRRAQPMKMLAERTHNADANDVPEIEEKS